MTQARGRDPEAPDPARDLDQDLAARWDAAYAEGERTRSWFEDVPTMSLRMLETTTMSPGCSVVDVGGGASRLVDRLLDRRCDVTVLDISGAALLLARERLGQRTSRVRWIVADVTQWRPDRCYDVWHDRAVLHFLTSPAQQASYADALRVGTTAGTTAVFGCFAPDGPTHCSGLPVVRRSAADLAAFLGTEWALVAEAREQHPTPGGAVQAFTWATFVRS